MMLCNSAIFLFSGLYCFFPPLLENFETDLTTLHPILTECRVFKSDLELALIQFANDISSEAHVEVIILSHCLNNNCMYFSLHI